MPEAAHYSTSERISSDYTVTHCQICVCILEGCEQRAETFDVELIVGVTERDQSMSCAGVRCAVRSAGRRRSPCSGGDALRERSRRTP